MCDKIFVCLFLSRSCSIVNYLSLKTATQHYLFIILISQLHYTMNNFKKREDGFATKAIHVEHETDSWSSTQIVQPIVTTAIYRQDEPDVMSVSITPSILVYYTLLNNLPPSHTSTADIVILLEVFWKTVQLRQMTQNMVQHSRQVRVQRHQ